SARTAGRRATPIARASRSSRRSSASRCSSSTCSRCSACRRSRCSSARRTPGAGRRGSSSDCCSRPTRRVSSRTRQDPRSDSERLRLLALFAFLAAGCAVHRSPQDELSAAEEEIGGGDLGSGLPRMERAYRELDVADPASWDRLGELARDADREIAQRAFTHAERLRWPAPGPANEVALSLPFEGRWLVTQGNR